MDNLDDEVILGLIDSLFLKLETEHKTDENKFYYETGFRECIEILKKLNII